jgi:hypothetical protein
MFKTSRATRYNPTLALSFVKESYYTANGSTRNNPGWKNAPYSTSKHAISGRRLEELKRHSKNGTTPHSGSCLNAVLLSIAATLPKSAFCLAEPWQIQALIGSADSLYNRLMLNSKGEAGTIITMQLIFVNYISVAGGPIVFGLVRMMGL